MRESLSTLRDLLDRSEFQTGVVIGILGLVLLAVLPSSPRWARPWGLVTSVGVLVGVQYLDGRRLGLVFGIGLMAIGGGLIGTRRRVALPPEAVRVAGWACVAVGAAIIPWKGQVDPDNWFYVATPVVAVAFGTALSTWNRGPALVWVGPLVGITAFAIWTTVPDTELARLLLGVALPLALGTLPPIRGWLSSPGAFALGGVLAWLPTLGGEPRPASIVGAWASIGVIVLMPIATLLWPARHLGTLTMFVMHSAMTLVAARVIGLWEWAAPALVAAALLYAAGLAVVFWLGRDAIEPDVELPT